MLVVLNKIDLIPEARRKEVAAHFDKPALVSLKTGEGMPALLERLSGMMRERTRRMKLRLPQSEFALMSLIHEQGKVISQDYDGNDILLDIIMPRRFESQLEPHLDPPLPARVPEAWESSGR
jgi:GTP-binding protein HflX